MNPYLSEENDKRADVEGELEVVEHGRVADDRCAQ